VVQSLLILGGACLCAVIGVGALVALVVLWRRQNQSFEVEDEPARPASPSAAAPPVARPRPAMPPPQPPTEERATVAAAPRPVPVAAPPPPPPPKSPPKPGDAPDPGFVKVSQRSSGQTIIAFDDDLDDDDK
jgi:hypothetical protein